MSALPVLIFDFDGTVSLGDGPVAAYAAAVAAELGKHTDRERAAGFAAQVQAELSAGVAVPGAHYIDGYDLVRQLALASGATETDLSAAYLASRERLGSADAPIIAPEGLDAFLRGARAERILLTNAPAIRIEEALDTLGLTGCFDRVITDGRKPGGLAALLDEFATERPVLSIGDVWENDLAPAHERGHATAYVGSRAVGEQRPATTYAAATVSELLPELSAWLTAVSAAH